jgi:hypothetical protein
MGLKRTVRKYHSKLSALDDRLEKAHVAARDAAEAAGCMEQVLTIERFQGFKQWNQFVKAMNDRAGRHSESTGMQTNDEIDANEQKALSLRIELINRLPDDVRAKWERKWSLECSVEIPSASNRQLARGWW